MTQPTSSMQSRQQVSHDETSRAGALFAAISSINVNTFDALKMAVNEGWIQEDDATKFAKNLITWANNWLTSQVETPSSTPR